eukprot:Nitzschia sp. Nitz4//scaffold188_size43225//34805//35731//NITZ4_007349-RA/size43225-processed-gene-0.24-mRNA-1//1//CDS//3329539856//1423//frame0
MPTSTSLNFFSSSQHSPSSSSPATSRTPLHVTNTWSNSTAAMWNHVRISLHWNVDTGRFYSFKEPHADSSTTNSYSSLDKRTSKTNASAPVSADSSAATTATGGRNTNSTNYAADEDTILEQRHAQNKNKLLMLLQLEQVLADRGARQAQWQALKEEFFVALVRRQIQRATSSPKPSITTPLPKRTWRLNSTLLDLQEYYRKLDACIQELEDRNEIIELEGFKQLVIRELQERAEAKEQHRKHLQVVHGQLMQRFLMEEWRIREGWSNSHHDWIAISNEDSILANSTRLVEQDEDMDGSEWVLCEYYN